MSIVEDRVRYEEELVMYSGTINGLSCLPAGITGLWQVSGRSTPRTTSASLRQTF